MTNITLLKKLTVIFEKLIPLLGTVLIFRANSLLFLRNEPIIEFVWLWFAITSAVLLLMLRINLKGLINSSKNVSNTTVVPKIFIFVNITLIAFMILLFQNMVIVEYFAPVGAHESIIYALLAGFLLYIAKLVIDCARLLFSNGNLHFVKEFYVLFAAFFLTHGLWVVTQPDFDFVNLKNRTMIASLFVETLPPSEGFLGHKAYVLGSTDAPYGFLVYEPERERVDEELPLLIFLHGGDETGDSGKQNAILKQAAKHGPSRYIKNDQWNPPTPMIVVSPQTTDGWWRPKMVHAFIVYMMDKYPVDRSRIYLTGLSRGGTGSFDYINHYGNESYVAAMLPLATDAIVRNSGEFIPANFRNTPIWLFINDDDKYVADYKATAKMIRSIAAPSNGSRVTVYPAQGHDAWTLTYTSKGQGLERPDYDPFDGDVFEWLLQHRKGTRE